MPRARSIYTANGSKPTAIEKREVFARRSMATGFDWKNVNSVSLKAAISSANQMGVAIMFAAASGGRGVCVKVYQDRQPDIDYAADPHELEQLLDAIIDAFSSGSEDIRESLKGGR